MNKTDLYTVAQMSEAEQRAVTEYGIPLVDLMDNAGKGLARAALEMCPDGAIGIFCGNGNNGGDGYVCAAELLRRGKRVTVWAIGAESLPEGSLVKNAADEFLAAGGVITPVAQGIKAGEIKCDLIVDALLGTGLTREVSGLYAHVIELINAAAAPVLSCDLPSGVDADTGQIRGSAVKADKTLMMGLAKLACALPPGCVCFGQVAVCDIGLPPALVAVFEPLLKINLQEDLQAWMQGNAQSMRFSTVAAFLKFRFSNVPMYGVKRNGNECWRMSKP